MRKWAYLNKPFKDDDIYIYKIMIYQTGTDGTYVFLYNSIESQLCTTDEWYETINEALEKWSPLIASSGWIEIEDPLKDCQHDAILPIRIKGRDTENPQWGKYEILQNGIWIDYTE